MPGTKLNDHLQTLTDRLDAVTVALLSDLPAAHGNLMAERRTLLADVTRTYNKLERLPFAAPTKATPAFPHDLQLLKKPARF